MPTEETMDDLTTSGPTTDDPDSTDPWLSDEQLLQAARERARPKGKKKTLLPSNSIDTSENDESARREEAEQVTEPPPTLEEPSQEPLVRPRKTISELPDAYQLLLQSSPEQATGEPTKSDEEASTPHPFGRQRKRLTKTTETESESSNQSDNTAEAEKKGERRSLRGWFTPQPEPNSAEDTHDPES